MAGNPPRFALAGEDQRTRVGWCGGTEWENNAALCRDTATRQRGVQFDSFIGQHKAAEDCAHSRTLPR